MILYNLLLFLLTILGGSAPMWIKAINDKSTNYLLAFSGSFLLCITFLHLLPETFEDMGHRAGLFLLVGFFLQLVIQRFTHGVEHGHTHIGEVATHDHAHHHHAVPIFSIVAGLSIHAFMEGLPLGFHYRLPATQSSLYLAVAAHKLPEAMLLTSLILHYRGKSEAWKMLIFFSMITPIAAMLAGALGTRYYLMSQVVMWIVPIVAGAFIHIATTIFFESGTSQHLLTSKKLAAILTGVALGLTTLLIH
ncbi:MAG: ZIP family metal transporter [Bacteroidetes bacterium]|nr:ZIP family metal transporter [Bacteroidota bacterium]